MYCAHCGTALQSGSTFCSSCGTKVATAASVPAPPAPSFGAPPISTAPEIARVDRPGLVTLLAVLQFIAAAGWLLGGLIAVAGGTLADSSAVPAVLVVGVFCLLGAAIQAACGIGLWKLKPYGRLLQIIFAVFGLLAFPFGTIISILVLIYLNKPGIKLLFSGRPASTFTPEERQLLTTLPMAGSVVVVLVAAVIVVGGLVTMSIVAAIAVPGLLRARMAGNEASAQATLRSLRGEQEMALIQAGAYSPQSGSLAERSGYRFEFYPGAAAERGIVSFAYVATPVVMGSTGSRSFCTDSSGKFCAVDDATLEPVGGVCPARCAGIQ